MIRKTANQARRTCAITLAALSLFAVTGTGPANAAEAPAVGVVCDTLGARAEGTALDCVTTGGSNTWQLKGTRPNPYRIGEVAQLKRYVGAKYIAGYTVKVTGGNPDATAAMTLTPMAIRNRTVPTGWKAVTAGIEIVEVGRQPAPSAGLYIKFVDPSNKEYSTFRYKKGDLPCQTEVERSVARSLVRQDSHGTIAGNLCSFVNPASINSSLLLRVQVRSFKAGQPLETWFSFL